MHIVDAGFNSGVEPLDMQTGQKQAKATAADRKEPAQQSDDETRTEIVSMTQKLTDLEAGKRVCCI